MRLNATRLGSIASSRSFGDQLYDLAGEVPPLDLNFAGTKTLDPRVTFTRASTGTFVGSDGLIQAAAVDAPRFDHNPTTGESLGLLVEEARTNLLLQSNGFDTTWTNVNSSETSLSGTAPDGTNTAWELKDTSTVSAVIHTLSQSVSFISGTAYTVSCWMKAGVLTEGGFTFTATAFTSNLSARVSLSTGAVITTSPGVTASTQEFPNGWWRVSATATATATASAVMQIRIMDGGLAYIGTGTGTIFIWGAQLEAEAFPTSYIPTTTATVTRAADVASITGSNFSSWYRQDEGTVFVEGAVPVGLTGARALASIDNGTASERIQLNHNGTTAMSYLVVNGGTTQFSPSLVGNSFPVGEYRKLAIAVKATDFAAITTPGTVGTGSSGTMPIPTQLQIGFGPARNRPNLPIKRLTYWPVRLGNEVLQRITQ